MYCLECGYQLDPEQCECPECGLAYDPESRWTYRPLPLSRYEKCEAYFIENERLILCAFMGFASLAGFLFLTDHEDKIYLYCGLLFILNAFIFLARRVWANRDTDK